LIITNMIKNGKDPHSGEASAILLVSRLASSSSFSNFLLERNALLVILVVNQPHFFSLLAVCSCCF
jgi:hypothetical protein